jgi:hypothetical protein
MFVYIHLRFSRSTRFHSELDALNIPVFLRVILDRAVRAKLAHLVVILFDQCPEQEGTRAQQGTYLGCRPNTLLNPFSTVGICLVNHFQRTNIYRSYSDVVATRLHISSHQKDAQESKSSVKM